MSRDAEIARIERVLFIKDSGGWSKNFLKQKRDRRKLKSLQMHRTNKQKASDPRWF